MHVTWARKAQFVRTGHSIIVHGIGICNVKCGTANSFVACYITSYFISVFTCALSNCTNVKSSVILCQKKMDYAAVADRSTKEFRQFITGLQKLKSFQCLLYFSRWYSRSEYKFQFHLLLLVPLCVFVIFFIKTLLFQTLYDCGVFHFLIKVLGYLRSTFLNRFIHLGVCYVRSARSFILY